MNKLMKLTKGIACYTYIYMQLYTLCAGWLYLFLKMRTSWNPIQLSILINLLDIEFLSATNSLISLSLTKKNLVPMSRLTQLVPSLDKK